jgi:membrane fusion protein (multidrug efflux system)
MIKRMILMLVVAALVIGGLAYFKTRQVKAAIKQFATMQPPPTAVTTVVAKEETWPNTLNIVGTVQAVHGVTISADLPGTVDKIYFDSGTTVHQGDVLLEEDTRQERAQLAAMQATLELNKINYDRMQQLNKEGVVSRQDYDKAIADQKQAGANVDEIKATIDRKTIRAPFTGVLGIRQANPGQYLAAGGAIVSLQSVNPIYVNFSVPQQNVGHIRKGEVVSLTADNLPGKTFRGRINALDSTVDATTRNIQVQATVENFSGDLRPGMFVQVDINIGASRSVIPLPASAINYAPFGNSVYIVTNINGQGGKSFLGVRQQFVKVEGSRGDQIGVVEGLKPGEEVVSSGVFKLRNSAPVAVNNKVQPGNNPNPHVEDN